jgi:multiple sugar transport system permease protein
LFTSPILSALNATPVTGHSAGSSPWQFWGRVLVLPYLAVFLIFVLYPVGYGLWLARDPQNYVKLFDDPIFFRTAINTVVFLLVAVNLKMALALALSGFFIQSRWWIKALGSAIHTHHPVGAVHAEPRVGRDQHDLLPAHRTGRP